MTGQLNLFNDAPRKPDPVGPGDQILEPIPLDKDQLHTPEDLVPPDSRIFITLNYDVTNALLSRLLRAFNENEESKIDMNRKEIASALTIPTKRIEGLAGFASKAELIKGKNNLTPFGKLVLKSDPHILNTGLLWFFHYLMVSNARLLLWSRLFNSIYYQVDEVTSNDVIRFFIDVKGETSDKQFLKSGRDEFKSVLHTYSDSLFKSLGLVLRIDERKYIVISDEFPIPPSIWLASILAYRDRYYPGAATLETSLLVDANFSPGRLFRQGDKTVRRVLDRLHAQGMLTVERSLGLDQVRFKSEFTWLSAVARHLQEEK